MSDRADNGSSEDTGSVGSDADDLNIEEEKLNEQVADIPFEDLQKVRSDGCYSFRPINVAQKPLSKTKRANKNRPMEMSSKKPVGRFREVIQVSKPIPRDPRFESLCGKFDDSRFKKSYSFVYDEELPAERKRLLKLLEKEKNAGKMEEIRKHISWIENQLKDEEKRRQREMRVSELRKTEKEAVKGGKRPFYFKKSEIRKQELQEKYQELAEKGSLDKFLAKRRRKMAAKDHKYVPYRRSEAT